MISIERPGAGWSTPHLYRTIRDWADDVGEFCDALALDRFACVGLSGGGPYTLACAHELPERVVVAGVLGGIGPTVGPEAAPGYTRALGYLGPLLRTFAEPGSWVVARILDSLRPSLDTLGPLYGRYGPRSDRPVLPNPRMMEVFLDALDEGLDGDFRPPRQPRPRARPRSLRRLRRRRGRVRRAARGLALSARGRADAIRRAGDYTPRP